jgi:ADP-ribose pyrophosphatase YjhB (NUDIX family)
LKTTLIVAGVIRHEDTVLLVQQQGPSDPAPSYALPGGVVEPGERLSEALRREVREETGLEVVGFGPLLYSLQRVDPLAEAQTLVYVFTVTEWRGAPGGVDPDGFVRRAGFYPVEDALDLLEQTLPGREMWEPVVAHLHGKVNAGAVWLYRVGPNGESELSERLG